MAKKKEELRKELKKDGLDLDTLIERKKKHVERLKRLDKRMQTDETLEPQNEGSAS